MMEKLSVDGQEILDNLHRIEQELCDACASCGRKREDITLMAVTKTVSPERINVLLDEGGVTCIGENRVQEYLSKKGDLHLDGVSPHLIGHLQSNKVRRIVGQVAMIQSVDSEYIARAISDVSIEKKLVTDVLVEVNIGNEESKSGISPAQTEELLWKLSALAGIRVRGLMTIPPILSGDCEKRAIFSQMRKLFIDIRGKNVDNVYMDILSMGMSADYIPAVLEGSTMVRIGSALFGKRNYA